MTTTDTKQKAIEAQIQATQLTWKDTGGRLYEYGKDEDCETIGINSVDTDDGNERWFHFAISCGHFSISYVVGTSFSKQEAYERFIEWKEDMLKIDDIDLKDYDEDSIQYNGNGVAIDHESVLGLNELFLVKAKK